MLPSIGGVWIFSGITHCQQLENVIYLDEENEIQNSEYMVV